MFTSLILPIVTILVSAFFLVNTFSMPTADSGLSAGTWPQVILVMMLVLGILLLIRELLAIKKNGKQEAGEKEPVSYRHWLVLAALILLTLCVKTIGFPISIFVFILLVGYILKAKPKTLVITAVVATFLIAFVFMNLLGISLPDGKSIFRIISRAISLELFF